MSKIDQKKREKKEALLLSAFELFTEKGIQNTSISEIVKRAKMAKGTFLSLIHISEPTRPY